MDSNAIAHWVHDIRNTLGTLGLYLESLEQPFHADTAKVLVRSDALLKKATSMCSDLMREAAHNNTRAQRRAFDVIQTVEEVLGLIAPIVPAATTLSLVSSGPARVLANPKDVFRILFNLVHNAVGAARAIGTACQIELAVQQSGTTVVISLADDGPGLPEELKGRLFQRAVGSSTNGYGLSIARELAERNGALLNLSNSEEGTEFTIELQGVDPEADCSLTPKGAVFAIFPAGVSDAQPNTTLPAPRSQRRYQSL